MTLNRVNFLVNALLWRQSITSGYSVTSRFAAILPLSPPAFILHTLFIIVMDISILIINHWSIHEWTEKTWNFNVTLFVFFRWFDKLCSTASCSIYCMSEYTSSQYSCCASHLVSSQFICYAPQVVSSQFSCCAAQVVSSQYSCYAEQVVSSQFSCFAAPVVSSQFSFRATQVVSSQNSYRALHRW